MYLLIQSVISIFKSLYGIHVNDIPVIIISDEQHVFENEFDIICGVNARATFNVFVRCNILNINEQIRISNSINRRIYSFDVNIRDITYVVQGMAPISYFGSFDIIRIIYNNIDEHFATVAEFETYVRTHLISYPEKHIFFTNYNIRRILQIII